MPCLVPKLSLRVSNALQPIGSSGASTGLAVNVDVANGTFWTSQGLHQCARNLCKTRNRNRKSSSRIEITILTSSTVDYLVFRNLLAPVQDPKVDGGWTWSPDFKELRKISGSRLRFSVNHRGKEGGRSHPLLSPLFNTS